MAPRETENNAYAKYWGDKQRTLWYVMVFSGVVNRPIRLTQCCTQFRSRDKRARVSRICLLTTPENTITYHNALCLSPQILQQHCFQFLLGPF